MNGVEILTSTEVLVDTVFNLQAFWTFAVISYVVMFVIALAIKSYEDLDWDFVILVVIVCD